MAKKNTKNRIIECSIELFRQFGYNQVTIEDICKESGITKSTFYYYFKSKDALLANFSLYSDSYVEKNFNQMIVSSNYVEQLWNFYKISTNPTFSAGFEISKQIFISNLNEDHHYFAPGDVKLWETEKLLIMKAQEYKQIQNTAPADELAETLVYAMEGVTLVWCIKNGRFDLYEQVKKVFNNILMVAPDITF